MPVRHAELFVKIGISPPRGVLITGTTGSGKTALANALCKDLN